MVQMAATAMRESEDLDINETVEREERERVIDGRVEGDGGEDTVDDETDEQGQTDDDTTYELEEGDGGEDTVDDETDEQGQTDDDTTYELEEGDMNCDKTHEPEGVEANEEETTLPKVYTSKDRRRYICKYCGISRSKKYLIASHILKKHEDKMEEEGDGDKATGVKVNTCQECGASFKKPAYLKQHMQSHSLEIKWCEALDPTKRTPKCVRLYVRLEWTSTRKGDLLGSSIKHASITRCLNLRPYACLVDECSLSYRRKDHLTRHLLQHKGKLFNCPVETCGKKFSYQGSMKKHVDEFHSDDSPSTAPKEQKQHICQELRCGKVFVYASKLRKHQDSHVMLDSVEVVCAEPGCMTYFTNEKSLKAHIQSCHLHINCEICGKKHLKKNIKRHLRTHGERSLPKRIKCNHKCCNYTFSTEGNLKQHIKAVHLEEKPFVCNFSGCGMRFAYKHVRDRHERVGPHVYCTGDFVESDEQFRSQPRGGRKRKYPTVEMLVRKRVTPPSDLVYMFNGEYE